MKILVTGGAGFIGSNLIDALGKRYEVKNYDLIHGYDVCDAEMLLKCTRGVDAIVHLAALTKVAECELKQKETLETNLLGTVNVLEAARKCDIGNVVFASSAAVYGKQKQFPIAEDACLMPLSAYALSKFTAEEIMQLYGKSFGIKAAGFRIFNAYGPGQDANSPYAAAIPIFIEKALKGQDIAIYGDGKQTRDFIYIRDIASAIEDALNKNPNQIVNLASGKETSILGLAETIKDLTNSKSKIIFRAPRAGDIGKSVADITKLKDLGSAPQYDLKRGLKRTISWFQRQI